MTKIRTTKDNMNIMKINNQELYETIIMVLDCDEITLTEKRKAALEDAVNRLGNGEHITPSQSGYWSNVVGDIREVS